MNDEKGAGGPGLKWPRPIGILVVTLATLVGPATASATFPGQNGPLLISSSTGPLPYHPYRPTYEWRIYRTGLDGISEEIEIPGFTESAPALSPDGTKLAFVKNPGDQLWLGDAGNPGSATPITTSLDYTGDYRSNPVFTPDGKSVILESTWSYRDWQESELQSYSLETGRLTRRPLEGDIQMSPDISPDGKKIAYTSAQFVNGSFQSQEIRLANGIDGKSWSFPSSVPSASPSFSPDGRRLAYIGQVGGLSQVFVSRVDGSNTRQLTFGEESNWTVEFSPDGKKIAYASGKDVPSAKITVRDLRSGQKTSIDFPGNAGGWVSQWSRSELFYVIGFKPKRRQLVVRVFNPGTAVVLAGGKEIGRRSVSSSGTYRVGVRWRASTKKRRVRVEFRPVGALPGSVPYLLQR